LQLYKKRNVFIYFIDVDDLRECLKGLPLERNILLLPINNNMFVERPCGGTHWSLLVFDRHLPTSRRFIHLDSSVGSGNLAVARDTAAALLTLLPDSLETSEASHICIVNEHACAQQCNGSDCGIYVLAFCEQISKDQSLDNVINQIDPLKYRRRIAAEITAEIVKAQQRPAAFD
jgi:Ulp1 family protease